MDVPLLVGYYNKTYFAIRPYSPDTFMMISPPIGRVSLPLYYKNDKDSK